MVKYLKKILKILIYLRKLHKNNLLKYQKNIKILHNAAPEKLSIFRYFCSIS